ncbi:hypothetical protein GGS21DRAFT_522762 [Xylaria nigripes]|nr:hypothetical protein GGS21DRAFT_522762 [Xylaria nigripes]
MDMETEPTRLRHTFAYPTDTDPPTARNILDEDDDYDDDDDDDVPLLDEQEQEEFIRALVHQNGTHNAQFRLLLFALPALASIPYLIALHQGSAASRTSVLALSSLAVTAWTLWALPPGATGIKILDTYVAGPGNVWPSSPSSSPLAQYLPILNVVLGPLVFLSAVAAGGNLWMACLPAVIYCVVVVAKMVMGSTDPERELAALRYELKGA